MRYNGPKPAAQPQSIRLHDADYQNEEICSTWFDTDPLDNFIPRVVKWIIRGTLVGVPALISGGSYLFVKKSLLIDGELAVLLQCR